MEDRTSKFNVIRKTAATSMAMKEMAEALPNMFKNPPILEDRLSNLLKDCQVIMFKNLRIRDLFCLRRVNQKMYHAVNEYLKNLQKTPAIHLEISQFERGIIFRMLHSDPKEWNYLYILKNALQFIPPTKRDPAAIYEFARLFQGTKVYVLDKVMYERYFFDDSVANGIVQSFPSQFFIRMQEALDYSLPDCLQLGNFTMAHDFIDNYTENVKQKIARIQLLNVIIPKELERKFADFVIDQKFHTVEVLICRYNFALMLNEDFVKRMAWNPSAMYHLDLRTDKPTAAMAILHAHNDFAMSTLIRFKVFRHNSIMIEAETLPAAIEYRFNLEIKGYWKLLVDKKLNVSELIRQRIKKFDDHFHFYRSETTGDATTGEPIITYNFMKKRSTWGVSIRWDEKSGHTEESLFMTVTFSSKMHQVSLH